ncbi:uncharacterized protein BJ212DRAFT_1578322 [Suillus subaureus]|uniref:NB-ARC domain-containing protein n=1 Tax=Suillus subaureus TaxID=48587 RepID=A0A9P7JC53_9AGAM|nr:uncharacterized protein BJ212DRAFT_1578322 [Suillus subaureus]KAG1813695.1 hypothetical protein BJ212DRAFT_1578322 [Suillus subaureus]
MSSKMPKAGRSRQLKNGPHAKQPSSEIKQSKDDSVGQLLDVTIAAINVTKVLVPIVLVQGILGTVANILTIAQSVIKNKSDFQAIASQCKAIRKILERVTKGATDDDLPGYLKDALSQLNISVNCINSNIESKQEQGFWRRLFAVMIDHDEITAWEKDLDCILRFFNSEAVAGMAIDMKSVKKALELVGNVPGMNVSKNCQIEPPSWPAMLFGHDNLVAELTNLVVSDEHLVLIGPRGMGKSSLAQAIINEPLIMDKFAYRHFFVAYNDGLDPSTITFKTFMACFARALGIEISGTDPLHQISTFFCSASALILDNAETFEEASALLVLRNIPLAIAEIVNIPGIILVLTSCSRRNAPNV